MDPQVELLLRKTQEDREALEFHLADAILGFYAQQAFEKLFKALIAFRNVRYERTPRPCGTPGRTQRSC